MTSISKFYNTFRLALVLLLAGVLVVESTAVSYSNNDTPVLSEQSCTSEIAFNAEKSPNEQGESQDLEIKAQEAIVTIAQLNLSQTLFFIYELKLVKEPYFRISHQTLPANQYFLTLFRLIIAPNAP